MGQHRHGLRFIDDAGSCLACKVEVMTSDLAAANARIERLREECRAWRDVRRRGALASSCRAVAASEAVDANNDLGEPPATAKRTP